jgi:hypothetical protein
MLNWILGTIKKDVKDIDIRKKDICKRIIKNYRNRKHTSTSALFQLPESRVSFIHNTTDSNIIDCEKLDCVDFKSFPFFYHSIIRNQQGKQTCDIIRNGDVIDEIIIIGKNIEKISILFDGCEIYKKYTLKSNYVTINDFPILMIAAQYWTYKLSIIGENVDIYMRYRHLGNKQRTKLANDTNIIKHPYLKDTFVVVSKGYTELKNNINMIS